MKPVIALVGRPNVGKSTLFNRLTRSRDALVADFPGLTRDRKYGEGKIGPMSYIVVDTGGIGEGEEGIDRPMSDQSRQAVQESDIVLFLVDGRAGLVSADEHIIRELRALQKSVHLVVNKTDGLDPAVASSDFYALGVEQLHCIAAAHGRGVRTMMNDVLAPYAAEEEAEPVLDDAEAGIKVAVLGRPNVGKSTLVNRLLGEERVVVYDQAGTTRDSIFIPFERQGQRYTLIDTAGVRRRGKVHEAVEKFSVIKAMQAVEEANVVVLVIDAREGITDQDLSLLGFILEAGRSLLIAVNKWDGLEPDYRERVKVDLGRRLAFVPWARVHTISALHGTGVGDLFGFIQKAWSSAFVKVSTNKLTQVLESAVTQHQPPIVGRHRIKLRYAHMGGSNPPLVVIHGNQAERVPDDYRRYLENRFRQFMKLEGTPVRIEFRSSENPYEGKKNTLTPRQIRSKKRLVKHIRKK